MLVPDLWTEPVIGAAIEVHRSLGPGLLESAYEACLCHELGLRGIPFSTQQAVSLRYKGLEMDVGYRLDLIVGETLVIEVKTVERLLPVHKAQLLTYLRLTGCRVGLLLNFNEAVLRSGISRVVL